MSQEDIPIMLVGNKCDLRKGEVSCVPTSYGQKLAMVRTNKHLTYFTLFQNQAITIALSLSSWLTG